MKIGFHLNPTPANTNLMIIEVDIFQNYFLIFFKTIS